MLFNTKKIHIPKWQCNAIFLPLFLLTSLTIAQAQTGNWKPTRSLLHEDGVESILVRVVQQRDDCIVLKYKLPSPRFQPVAYQTRSGMSAVQCALGNARLHSQPGKPEVPYINGRLFLPQGRIVESIRVIPDEVVELPGKYLLSYGEIPHPISSTKIVWAKPDKAIYESDNVFPAQTYDPASIQYRCGVAVGCIDIYPVRYLPKSGKISYFKTFTLEVKTKPDTGPGTGVRVRLDRIRNGFLTEENPEALNSYVDGSLRGEYQHVICNPAQTYNYIVITAQSFIDASTDPNLDDLIAHRELKGFTCNVTSIEEVLSKYRGRDDADKLRDFIKDAYNNWQTEFVLLGGDIDIIPLETVYDSKGSGDDIPTDIPYQCLDQTSWDDDWEAEVMIGRFSAENETEFANQIYKTLAYETDPLSEGYLTKGLSLGEELDKSTFAKEAMQELEGYFPTPDDFSFDGLHDKDGDWSKSELIAMYNTSAYSIVNHLGHSNYTMCMKMSNGTESDLTNNKFVFVKSQGCMPGGFDRDCLAERLTNSTRTGMFAVVFNARYGWYSPGKPKGGSSHKLHQSFWKACWEQDMDYFSEFNEYSHRMNTNYRWDVLESNLFGDPATLFRGKEVPAFIQVVSPNGAERWEQGRTFNIRWDDNVDDEVKIELLKGNSIAEVLAASTPSNGSFPWNIAAEFLLGTDYKIIISSNTNDTLIDTSDGVFSIEKKSNLVLLSPNGGEVIEKGSEVEITWVDDLDGEIKIDLFKTSKILVNVVPSTPSNGSYIWKIPETINSGADYKVRVISVEKDWLFEESDQTITILNPVIINFPYVQNFDDFEIGTPQFRHYWEQLGGDDLDWTIWKDKTPSKEDDQGAATGADGDHTSGNGIYLYTESSGGNNPEKEMDMVTPVFHLGYITEPILTLWCHMFSDDDGEDHMGNLHMDINVDGTWKAEILHLTNDHGDVWFENTIDLASYAGKKVQFRFRGITGDSWSSDICIDDFKIDGIVNKLPQFTSAPVTNAKAGEEYAYAVSASDADGSSLEFGHSTLPGWLKLTDNGNGTAGLKGTPAGNDVGGNNVALTVTDGIMPEPTEQAFKITVEKMNAPVITEGPKDQTVNAKETAKFSVKANGLELSYQWQKDEKDVSGATGSSYTTPQTDTSDNGFNYRCIVSNLGGSVTSKAAKLTVLPVTAITKKDVGKIPIRKSLTIVPNPAENSDYIYFSFDASDVSEAQLTVYDAVGNRVWETEFPAGSKSLAQWNLRNDSGKKVENGVYLAVLWLVYYDGKIEQIKENVGIQSD